MMVVGNKERVNYSSRKRRLTPSHVIKFLGECGKKKKGNIKHARRQQETERVH
jgi:hypothetical protein